MAQRVNDLEPSSTTASGLRSAGKAKEGGMTDRPVLIVGAGPTGLVLALWLTRLGTSVENFRVWLSRLRQTYRHALRAEVASTVSDPADIDNELHYVYRVLTA